MSSIIGPPSKSLEALFLIAFAIFLLRLLVLLAFALLELRRAILDQIAGIIQPVPLRLSVRNIHDALVVEHVAAIRFFVRLGPLEIVWIQKKSDTLPGFEILDVFLVSLEMDQ